MERVIRLLKTITILILLGTAGVFAQQDVTVLIKAAERKLEETEQFHGSESVEYAEELLNLAGLYRKGEDADEALDLYREAYLIFRMHGSAPHRLLQNGLLLALADEDLAFAARLIDDLAEVTDTAGTRMRRQAAAEQSRRFFRRYRLMPEPRPMVKDTAAIVTIAAVGDLMCHSPQFRFAQTVGGGYDFTQVYTEMLPWFDQADFLFGNLETVTAGAQKGGFTGYPRFNTPDEYVTALRQAGFDILSTANNHSVDRGEYGIRRTIEVVRSHGLPQIGTYLSAQDRDSIRVLEKHGLSIAWLAYTFSTNGISFPKEKPYLVNMIDFDPIASDIKRARELADVVLVYYHYGSEYITEPNESQLAVVEKTRQLGADIILGGHPHVLQPVINFQAVGARVDSGVAAYSLGNFYSNQRKRYRDAGVVLFVDVAKTALSDSVYIADVRYLPTWVFKGYIDGESHYKVLPAGHAVSDTTYPFLSPYERRQMEQAFDDTRGIIEQYDDSITVIPSLDQRPRAERETVSAGEPADHKAADKSIHDKQEQLLYDRQRQKK